MLNFLRRKMSSNTQDQFEKGAAFCRDSIIANINGMQNDLDSNEEDPRFQVLQELKELIYDRYIGLDK